MRKVILMTVFAALMLSLSSCISTTRCEPKNDSDTLCVGRAIISFRGLDAANGGQVLSGDKKNNIGFYVIDHDSDSTFNLNTDKTGLFMTDKFIPGHTYQIVSFSYNKDMSAGNIFLDNCLINYVIEPKILKGHVNPIADITIDMLPGNKRGTVRWNFKTNGYTLGNVAEEFKASFPKSKWNNYPVAPTPVWVDD